MRLLLKIEQTLFVLPLNKRTALLRQLLNFTPGIVFQITGNLSVMRNSQTNKENNNKNQSGSPQILLIYLERAGANEDTKKPSASRLDAHCLGVQTSHIEQGWTHLFLNLLLQILNFLIMRGRH